MSKVIKVLIIDDSAYVRKVVNQILSRSPFIEVVGTARDGREGLEKVEQLKPDVVTCDLIMPEMDGVEFVREQAKRGLIPIVIMSIASETAEMALAALELGAVDFVQKPTALASEKILEVSDELIAKVKTASAISLERLPTIKPTAPLVFKAATPHDGKIDIVVIGISTGGPQALRYLIPQLPVDFPVPLAVVMHMPVGYTEMYASRLNELSSLEFHEASEGEVLRPGVGLLASAGRHLSFNRNSEGTVTTHLDARPFGKVHRPAVDVLFQSAAEIFGPRVLAILMTGMGSDGKEGAAWVKAKGGTVYTESEDTCVVYGMPRSAVEAGLSDRSIPLDEMAQAILEAI
jgi:two-component system chemotaxis response regulator CheB